MVGAEVSDQQRSLEAALEPVSRVGVLFVKSGEVEEHCAAED